MKKVRNSIPSLVIGFLPALVVSGLFLSISGYAQADEKAVVATSKPNAVGSTSSISFLTRKTQLWLDRSQILCFSSAEQVDEARYYSFKVDEKYLHVLIPPTLLPGYKIGYVRLRPVMEGHTQIVIDGASIDVDVVKDTAASTLEQTRPEIVSPVEGSVIWGTFAVGVEQLNFSSNEHPVQPFLRLPDGHEIAAHVVPDSKPGPHLKYAYTVDSKMLHPGANDLVAVCKDAAGHEVSSDPLDVVVINPDPAAITSGDCKDTISTLQPQPKVPVNPPKPSKPVDLVADDKGVYGQVVTNPGEYPPWCMPVKVPGKGRYVMVMTARGDIGGNALPTLAVLVDDNNNALSTARLATTDWQRIAVGRPFTLESGDHVLSVRFRNGFNQGPKDERHLYLAKYELLRIDPPAAPAPAVAVNTPAASSTMQATATMQSAAQSPTMQESASAPRERFSRASAVDHAGNRFRHHEARRAARDARGRHAIERRCRAQHAVNAGHGQNEGGI